MMGLGRAGGCRSIRNAIRMAFPSAFGFGFDPADDVLGQLRVCLRHARVVRKLVHLDDDRTFQGLNAIDAVELEPKQPAATVRQLLPGRRYRQQLG